MSRARRPDADNTDREVTRCCSKPTPTASSFLHQYTQAVSLDQIREFRLSNWVDAKLNGSGEGVSNR